MNSIQMFIDLAPSAERPTFCALGWHSLRCNLYVWIARPQGVEAKCCFDSIRVAIWCDRYRIRTFWLDLASLDIWGVSYRWRALYFCDPQRLEKPSQQG